MSHSVTVVGQLIFYSNETHALPLCRASLDRFIGAEGMFFKCVKIVRLIPIDKLQKLLMKKNKQ